MQNIVITGGLGYIGFELCKLYSGISWKKKITVIDNSFFSARVNQLRKWNIDFYQLDILEETDKLKKVLKSANIIHHLAGVTNVAHTKDEELKNPKLAEYINHVAINGTNNILKNASKECKIIFPSTHVVFDGLKETKHNITEKDNTCPQVSYSKSKNQNELDIKASGKKYIILRLGSVYGYSEDSTRINIMPNLFSKITSEQNKIKLYGGGEQFKSLVPLMDVVRCFKFFSESKIENETFHLTKDNIKVKDVAKICKKIEPNIEIENTQDSVPNPGYTLSNKKLLDVGFNFIYDLETCLKEMIQKWSKNELNLNIEYTTNGEKEFVDERGKINNFELTEPVNLIGFIESKKNTIRANHFHPIQEQKCIIIKGEYISVLKDLIEDDAPLVTQVIKEGQLVTTKPNVAHTMVFTKDTIFLNLVRGEREHENYGITHTIKHILVDENFKEKLINGYKFHCRCCGNSNLYRVLSLGLQPLANNLVDKKNDNFEKYPLELNYCTSCYNCQLSFVVEPEILFKNYLYVSSTTESFKEHFNQAAKKYVVKFKLDEEKSSILDIGSNDGIGLIPFKKLNFKNLIGVEPAKNICKIAEQNGVKTINSFFDKSILDKISGGSIDLIMASNVFAHSDKIDEMTEIIKKILSKQGVLILEVQYLVNTLKDLTFDNIYHEHVNYWCLHSLRYFFKKHKMKTFDAEKINTHGGSLRVYISADMQIKESDEFNSILNEEMELGINKIETFIKFEKKILNMKRIIQKNLSFLKKQNKNLIGYGAPAKSSTVLNYFKIGDYFENILEDNHLKFNKYFPEINLKIIDKNKYVKKNNDEIIVLAWNFFEYIKKNNSKLGPVIRNIKDLQLKDIINEK